MAAEVVAGSLCVKLISGVPRDPATVEAVWQAVGKPHTRNLSKRLPVQHQHVASAMNIAHNGYDNSCTDQSRHKN